MGSRLKRLHQLVRSAREEGVRDEDGITTAEGLIRATEAEVHLSGVSSLVEAIECASSANVSEIKRLDDALATAKTHGSHSGMFGLLFVGLFVWLFVCLFVWLLVCRVFLFSFVI